MKKYFYFLFALVLISCAEEGSEEPEIITGTSHMDQETYTETEEALEGLRLNGGNKWKVEQSTHDGMEEIKSLVVNHEGEEFKELGKEIKEILKTVIDECTMTGEDHDQFHIVLKAMMKESKALKKGKSNDLVKMNRYLEMYDKHFEL